MIFFNDDLTENKSGEQKDLRALTAFVKELGHNSIVKAGLFFLNGRGYRYDKLFKLPEGISLLRAKNLHILEDKANSLPKSSLTPFKHIPLQHYQEEQVMLEILMVKLTQDLYCKEFLL